MRYFLIAGEASGDLLGASLMQGIKQMDADSHFNFWGGDLMLNESPGLLQHYKEINIMGFVEVVFKIRTIIKNIAKCKQQILDFKPDVVIFIDYPGFNLRIAEFAKKAGFKTCYYIAPKIWAWNEKRGLKLEKYIDELLLIFPFEVDYFKKWKIHASYTGNPLIKQIKNYNANTLFRESNELSNKPIIALLPGSRKQEISRIMPTLLKVVKHFPAFQFVIAGAPSIAESYYQNYLNDEIKIVIGQTYDLLSNAAAAVVCSGTASLETAIFNVPQVCAYVANNISYQIAIRFVKVKYISLVNLNLNRKAVSELIQHNFNEANIVEELKKILPDGEKHQKLMQDYHELRNLFGDEKSERNAAKIITDLAKKQPLA